MRVEGHTFLITGGASGLGAATSHLLAQQGARVVIADVDEEAGEELASGLGKQGRFAHADVTDERAVQKLVDLAVDEFEGLHGTINCAGIGGSRRVLGREGPYDLGHFTKVVTVNLIGTFNVIRLAAEAMAKNDPSEDGERGVVVNTASVAAFEGQVGQAAYSASKGGIVGMTLPIARELARHGIRVATVAPGIFETPLLGRLPEEARESLGEQVPFPPRLGRPEEYAALVRHIVENVMVNGEVIRLDGAIRMAPR